MEEIRHMRHLNKLDFSHNILYSWNMSATTPMQREKLYASLKQLKITTLYQEFSTEYLSTGNSEFIAELNNHGVEVYHLCGDPSWALDFHAEHFILEIDKVLVFNRMRKNSIKGIVFDVEPYIADNYTLHDLYQYVLNLKKAYAYAQSNQLYMVAAIPYWLEQKDTQLLPEIIQNGCDEVSVMNYYITKTREHIAEEIHLARQAGKWINTIYELNFEQKDTFDSLEQIHADFNNMYHYYEYNKLRIAYHHFGDLT